MNRNKEYEMLLKQVRQKVKERIDKDYPNVNLSKYFRRQKYARFTTN